MQPRCRPPHSRSADAEQRHQNTDLVYDGLPDSLAEARPTWLSTNSISPNHSPSATLKQRQSAVIYALYRNSFGMHDSSAKLLGARSAQSGGDSGSSEAQCNTGSATSTGTKAHRTIPIIDCRPVEDQHAPFDEDARGLCCAPFVHDLRAYLRMSSRALQSQRTAGFTRGTRRHSVAPAALLLSGSKPEGHFRLVLSAPLWPRPSQPCSGTKE